MRRGASGWVVAAAIALCWPASAGAQAAEVFPGAEPAPVYTPGAIGACALRLGALRDSPDVARVLDGVDPVAVWPELEGFAAGVGAGAMPDGAIAISAASWAPDDSRLLVSGFIGTDPPPAALVERLGAWGTVSESPGSTRWTHPSGVVAVRRADGVWLFGQRETVDAALVTPDPVAQPWGAEVDGSGLLHCAAQVGPDAPLASSAWFTGLVLDVSLVGGLHVAAELTTAPGRGPALVAELQRTLVPALASPQLAERVPIQLPVPVIRADGDRVHVALHLEGAPWTALVDSARAAVQSEL